MIKRLLIALCLLCLNCSFLSAVTLPSSTSYKVNLSWTAPVSNGDAVVGYNMYRELIMAGSYEALNTSPITGTTYIDTGLLYGVSYNYYATSVDGSGVESVPSNTVAVTIPFVPYAPVVGTVTGQ
jgi:hypothetical protein